jgi:gas vesicle protein
MGKSGKIAVGAVIAATAGYIAGVLTAPKSGKETRKDISEKAIKAKREAEARLKVLYSDIERMIADGKKQVDTLGEKAKKEWVVVLKTATAAKDTVREVLSAVHEGDAEDKDLKKAIKEANSAVEHLKTYLQNNAKKA